MPAPLALTPAALTALRIGAVAALAIYAARRRRGEPRDALREATLDQVDEGVELSTESSEGAARYDAAGKFRRTIRLGQSGPGVELDMTALARLRLRRV
ncbi:MAG: hypothetical protein AAGE13_14600 [Pseudomonadota bacterium]